MAEGYIESKGAVITFLKELQKILLDSNMELILQPRDDQEYEYTTDYCLEQLEYDKSDVIK